MIGKFDEKTKARFELIQFRANFDLMYGQGGGSQRVSKGAERETFCALARALASFELKTLHSPRICSSFDTIV
jgi:hypothetical protein